MPKMHNQVVMRPKRGGGQVVAYTGTSGTVTNGVTSGVNTVLVRTTTDAYVAVVPASGGAATSADFPTVANVDYWFTVHPGEKISAIQQLSGGNLLTCEMTQ